MRILLLSPDFSRAKSWVSEHVCEEIARQHDVIRVYGLPSSDLKSLHVPYLVEQHKPDLVIMWRLQFGKRFTGMADVRIPKVCFVEDYFPRHYGIKNDWLTLHAFDLVFFSQAYFIPIAQTFQDDGDIPTHTRFTWLPFSVDTAIYHGDSADDRPIDVSFVCSLHQSTSGYPHRREVAELLQNLQKERPDLNIFVKLLENPRGLENPGGGVYCEDYAELLRNSKIVVASLDEHGSANYRHFEIPASGALLLTDGPPKDFDRLSFCHACNCVVYRDVDDLRHKITNYLRRDATKKRLSLAMNGQMLVHSTHANSVRVRQTMHKIERVCRV